MKIPSSMTVKQLKEKISKLKDTDKVTLGIDYATSEDDESIEGDTGVKCTLEVGNKTLLEDYCEM